MAGCAYWGVPNYDLFEMAQASTYKHVAADPAFEIGRMVPTGPVGHPQTISMLACAYMGQPAA